MYEDTVNVNSPLHTQWWFTLEMLTHKLQYSMYKIYMVHTRIYGNKSPSIKYCVAARSDVGLTQRYMTCVRLVYIYIYIMFYEILTAQLTKVL
jgi:hypothetical protein